MTRKTQADSVKPAFPTISHPKKRAFLQALARTCSVMRAAKAAKVDISSHYYWRDTDPEYVKAFQIAQDRGVEALETEAIRRANEGWEENVYHQGKVVGKKRVYDSTLLIFLLKGAMPEKYREQYSAQISGTVTHALEEGLAARIIASRQKRLAGEDKALPPTAAELSDKKAAE